MDVTLQTACRWRKGLIENIDTHLSAKQEPMKQALVELLRIPSVCDEGAGE